MNWIIAEMTRKLAEEILQWQYEAPFELYNNELTDESLKELMNGSYIAIVDENHQLSGYYCTGISAIVPAGKEYDAYNDNMIDVGLRLKPELTGAGRGRSFLSFILQNIESTNKESLPLRLTVACFNKRAIKLYENVGFMTQQSFESNKMPFQTMVKFN